MSSDQAHARATHLPTELNFALPLPLAAFAHARPIERNLDRARSISGFLPHEFPNFALAILRPIALRPDPPLRPTKLTDPCLVLKLILDVEHALLALDGSFVEAA